ncbi:pyridoxamine 5'-phosphate oxidase [Marinomonas communis]|uniref:pyridoxamine 5'-phosphate oxidase n=1 Tax=Marinomonas communis TaxID=28254 RepID=UPI00100449F6|nr:pyridoxamine 5'-phosphate oxidase [Marinomonas communis]MCC4272953.1 pyridoxamine 5'-phosphate oxidase [Marinomonas communis]RUM54900.1 MAG: pyridoxamine 5'-phosphate oxidase [Marinomonas sp.]
MNRDLQSLRRDYQFDDLTEEKAGQDPLALFDEWLNLAIESCPEDPTGMLLSTVDADNKPHCRTVLLKQRDGDAFSFFTNYDSDKGQDIAQNPNVCLTFFWPSLSRQVRIEGVASKVDRSISENYFATRPKGSQLAASISRQSQVIDSREVLSTEFAAMEEQYKDIPVPCPENWGGYSVKATTIEFWQGRPSRLHDRIIFTARSEGKWSVVRKAP